MGPADPQPVPDPQRCARPVSGLPSPQTCRRPASLPPLRHRHLHRRRRRRRVSLDPPSNPPDRRRLAQHPADQGGAGPDAGLPGRQQGPPQAGGQGAGPDRIQLDRLRRLHGRAQGANGGGEFDGGWRGQSGGGASSCSPRVEWWVLFAATARVGNGVGRGGGRPEGQGPVWGADGVSGLQLRLAAAPELPVSDGLAGPRRFAKDTPKILQRFSKEDSQRFSVRLRLVPSGSSLRVPCAHGLLSSQVLLDGKVAAKVVFHGRVDFSAGEWVGLLLAEPVSSGHSVPSVWLAGD